VAYSIIYDVVKTSRRQEYAIFTHSEGLIFATILEKYNTALKTPHYEMVI